MLQRWVAVASWLQRITGTVEHQTLTAAPKGVACWLQQGKGCKADCFELRKAAWLKQYMAEAMPGWKDTIR